MKVTNLACPCGLPRQDGHLICWCCWKAAPGNLKRKVMRSNPPAERKWAATGLLRFARSRYTAKPILKAI